jgi:Glycosyltransferase family 92
MSSLAITAIMKDEIDAIIEWVAFHKVLGASHICIYDNGSTDGGSDLLKSMADADIIEYVPWNPPTGSPQLTAYNHFIDNNRHKYEWVAFIDADEFLTPLQHDKITDVLTLLDHDYEDVCGIGVHWKTFGSSGLATKEPGLVIERFTRCARPNAIPNNCIKTVAKPNLVSEAHIHSCNFSSGNYIDERGRTLELRQRGMDDRITHELIQVNHYMVKSREEYEKKRLRGNGNRNNHEKDKYDRFSEEYWSRYDLNDEQDVSAQRFLPMVKIAMQTILDAVGSARDPAPEAMLRPVAEHG